MNWIWTFPFAAMAGAFVWAQEYFTPEQLRAEFYYDLGPDQIDVSHYPWRQRDNYEVFARTCSQCHTLARPINAPIVSRQEWGKYVRLMQLRWKAEAGVPFPSGDAEAIIDFLTYDSGVRKVNGHLEFERQTAELQALFERVVEERSRRGSH